MPVLVTGIHAFVAAPEGVEARDERAHDGGSAGEGQRTAKPDSNGLDPGIQRQFVRAGESAGLPDQVRQ